MSQRPSMNQQLSYRSLLFGKRRVRPILQAEAAECGLASLAMIANYFGYEADLNSLRQRFPISLKGCNLQDLAAMAHELGLVGRALRLELDDLDKLATPCILHWDMSHFVVLAHATSKSIDVCDPAFGRRRMSLEAAGKHFTGVALELTKSPEFKPEHIKRRLRFGDVFANIRGMGRALAKIFLLSLVIQLFSLAAPVFTQLVLDEVVVNGDQGLLILIVLAFIGHAAIKASVNYMRSWGMTCLSGMLNIHLATGLFEHLLHLPLDFFQKRHVGDIVSRFQSLSEIKNLLSHQLVAGLIDGVMAIVTLILMIVYAPLLSLVIVLALGVVLVVRAVAYYQQRVLQEEALVRSAKERTNFLETVRSVQSIKLACKEADRKGLWTNLIAEVINSDIKMARYQMMLQFVSEVVVGIEFALVMYLGAKAILRQEQSIGTYVAFMAYQSQFKDSLLALSDKIINLRFAGIHMDRISDIVFVQQERNEKALELRSHVVEGAITVQGIAFRYSRWEPFVVDDLSFDVRPGESVAIVAPSGAGKSTLLKIMLGLLKPTRGSILIDGVDLRHIDPRNYRQQIAAVMQDDQLLSGSIADNIVFFEAMPDSAWMEECAKLANIYDDIMAMPMRFNTLIGDMGSSLSGGQKQRVMLARALYRRPKILFLDEATSHLDAASESLISENIRKLPMTRVMIAHRHETIATAERVIYLGGGGKDSAYDHGVKPIGSRLSPSKNKLPDRKVCYENS